MSDGLGFSGYEESIELRTLSLCSFDPIDFIKSIEQTKRTGSSANIFVVLSAHPEGHAWLMTHLNTPVFREPGRAMDEHRTSPIKPLKSSTWLRYLRWLGRNSGLEQSFTQYCARRGLANAVNSKSILASLWAFLLWERRCWYVTFSQIKRRHPSVIRFSIISQTRSVTTWIGRFGSIRKQHAWAVLRTTSSKNWLDSYFFFFEIKISSKLWNFRFLCRGFFSQSHIFSKNFSKVCLKYFASLAITGSPG